jgi:hypothetical protein
MIKLNGGFMKLSTLLMPLLVLSSMANAGDLDILRGSTTGRESNVRVRPGSAQEVELKVNDTLKRKCNDDGCVIFVNDGSGNEFRVSVGAGEGPNYGAGGGGINIYNGSSGQYYGVNLSYTHSNFTCRLLVPESVARYIEMYVSLISTPEFANKVLRKAEMGEDMPMPEPIKLAFMTLATLKSSSQSNCGVSNNGNAR